jgi:eukaryotic-like serine/threonine-protein kinase
VSFGSKVTSPSAPRGYETIRLLGSGGFGEVVLARHNALDRLVAIKFLRREALADPDALNRFQREAVVLAGLEDPTVVRVHDVRFADAEPSIIMEYVPGEPLDALLEQQVLTISEQLVILGDVATALETAAGKGIAHRDVKPANVFVMPDGHAKLGDFGLARIATNQNVFRTATDTIGGTPAYLPPEVAMGTGEPDARSDTYSFAVMAYEMLTGRLPFVDRGIMGLIAAHAREPVPAPETLLDGFPPKASAALLSALAKEPERRPTSRELVAALAAVPESAWPAAVRQPTRGAHARTVRVAPAPAASPRATPVRSPRKRGLPRRAIFAAAAVFVAGLVGLLVVLLVGVGASKPDPLAVSAVSVRASTGAGTCPRATWTFTADIALNGSPGTLKLRWLRPDGVPTTQQTLPVASGERTARVELRFAVTGSRSLQGAASLQVLDPPQRRASSAVINYTCPTR